MQICESDIICSSVKFLSQVLCARCEMWPLFTILYCRQSQQILLSLFHPSDILQILYSAWNVAYCSDDIYSTSLLMLLPSTHVIFSLELHEPPTFQINLIHCSCTYRAFAFFILFVTETIEEGKTSLNFHVVASSSNNLNWLVLIP